MDFFIEFVLEAFLDGSICIVKSNKVPRFIRIILAGILFFFFISVIFGIIFLSFVVLEKSVWCSLLLFFIAIILFVGFIFKIREIWREIRRKNNS